MKTRILLTSLAFVLSFAHTLPASQAGAQTIAGKWLGNADTPNGPVDLIFEIHREANQFAGTAALLESTTPISSLRFDDGKFSGEIAVMGGNYRLAATLNEGKLTGTWEQVGGEYKGTWTAAREPAAAASGIAGAWDIVAVTPDGNAVYLLELNKQGDALGGTIGGDMGTAALDALSYKDGKLHFEVDGGGTVYIIDGALEGDNSEGSLGNIRWRRKRHLEWEAERHGLRISRTCPGISRWDMGRLSRYAGRHDVLPDAASAERRQPDRSDSHARWGRHYAEGIVLRRQARLRGGLHGRDIQVRGDSGRKQPEGQVVIGRRQRFGGVYGTEEEPLTLVRFRVSSPASMVVVFRA